MSLVDAREQTRPVRVVRDDRPMVTIGIRIEFYDKPSQTPFEPSEGYQGAVRKEQSYTALSVPAIGESIGIISLTVGSEGVNDLSPMFTGPPLLRVQKVEHYPEPVGSPDVPRAIAVVHTTLGYDGAHLERFVRNYKDAGWTWQAESPNLQQAWNAVRTP